MKNICLGILGSTRGTSLQAITDAIEQNRLLASIPIVISNRENAPILKRAQLHGAKAQFVDPAALTRDDYDQKISAILQAYHVDLIVLIGYMRILSDSFVAQWRHKMINVHPSLLPDFAGGMDQSVHKAVLEAGVKETGCTVHYVTEEVDAGPIIVQKRCAVLSGDTVETLKERVQKLEAEALVEAIEKIAKT